MSRPAAQGGENNSEMRDERLYVTRGQFQGDAGRVVTSHAVACRWSARRVSKHSVIAGTVTLGYFLLIIFLRGW